MSDHQQSILKELVEKYLEGGNARNDSSAPAFKARLDAIRDFVKENFSD